MVTGQERADLPRNIYAPASDTQSEEKGKPFELDLEGAIGWFIGRKLLRIEDSISDVGHHLCN